MKPNPHNPATTTPRDLLPLAADPDESGPPHCGQTNRSSGRISNARLAEAMEQLRSLVQRPRVYVISHLPAGVFTRWPVTLCIGKAAGRWRCNTQKPPKTRLIGSNLSQKPL
jgi:hypothetical protein